MPNHPATILCVDDEQSSLRVRKLVLEAQGYRILEATTAEIALHLFKVNDVDLVITDHLMPTIPGTELAKQMKQLKPTVQIALLTGLSEPPDGIQHADCYIVKGDDLENVLRKISDLLRSRHNAESARSAAVGSV